MTHSEIYKKFFIEYDKDMITSSYPSLTLVEVSNFLNKAYLALIAQKFTGNNLRQVPFEGDTKQLEDLQPLIDTTTIPGIYRGSAIKNELLFECASNMLYYVDSQIWYSIHTDDIENVQLVSHEYAKKFMNTNTNLPWIENPACVIEKGVIYLYYDKYAHKDVSESYLVLKYIKRPQMFNGESTNDVKFELSDSVAEELINLAITFVLDNVESSRIQTKTNLLKLES